MKANLNGKDVDFIIDTGAAVSAISESTYTEIGKPKQLPNDWGLKGPDNSDLKSLGQIEGRLKLKDSCEVEEIMYVVKDLHKPLLG